VPTALHFDNRFVRDLPGDPRTDTARRQVLGACWSAVHPTPVAAPQLLAHSAEVAALVGFAPDDHVSPRFAEVFGGNALLAGMQPYAACYGGHQFGNWAGQLGDGRAITLGEVLTPAGQRWELQLKGAGPTPYSRTADGRAVLRSSLREFLCSEAMQHLGVPTTRALSLVGTGESVLRDMFYNGNAQMEPGAVVCRVAPSFIRFGNFEILAARGELELLQRLVDFTIARDFPHIAATGPWRMAQWFREVCERTATMIVGWMRVGFVHGVMNTDNMSILGLTIDYGPYGVLDDFDPGWTPNTTDAHGRRYAYGRQPAIAQWNLERLAEALQPVMGNDADLVAGLDHYAATFNAAYTAMLASKFGLASFEGADRDIATEGLSLLERGGLDHTRTFRALADYAGEVPTDDDAAVALLGDVWYDEASREQHTEALAAWLRRWHARAARGAAMRAVNPKYVLRNYLAQQAIDAAEQGNTAELLTLLDVLRRPYNEQPGAERFAGKRPEWARVKPGCSMLSCSS